MTRSRPPTSASLERLERRRRSNAALLATLFLTCSYVPGAMVVAAPQIFARVGPGVSNLPLQASTFDDPSFGEISDAVNVASGNAYVDLGQISRNNSNVSPDTSSANASWDTSVGGDPGGSGGSGGSGGGSGGSGGSGGGSDGSGGGSGGSGGEPPTIPPRHTDPLETPDPPGPPGGPVTESVPGSPGGTVTDSVLADGSSDAFTQSEEASNFGNFNINGLQRLEGFNTHNPAWPVEWTMGIGDGGSQIFRRVVPNGQKAYCTDSRTDIVGFNKFSTGTNSTEIHVLNGGNNFQNFSQQMGTGQGYDPSKIYKMGDWDGDNRPDLIQISQNNNGTGKVEVHIFSASSDFKTHIFDIATALGAVGDNWDFNVLDWNQDGKLDIVGALKNNSGTNSVEIHVLNGANNFQGYLDQRGTGMPVQPNYNSIRFADWDGDRRPDMIGIYRQNTGTGKTEIHVVTAASGYRQLTYETGTGLGYTGENTDVDISDWDKDGKPDLVVVVKNNTGTQKTEAHIFSGATNFQNALIQTGTVLGTVPNDQWSFTTIDYPTSCGARGYNFDWAPTWIKERYAGLGSQVTYYQNKPQPGQSTEENWLVTYTLPSGRQIAHYYDHNGNRTTFFNDGEYTDYIQTPHEQYRTAKYQNDAEGIGGSAPKTDFTYTSLGNGHIRKIRDSWGRATTYNWDDTTGVIERINLNLQDENNDDSYRRRVEYGYKIVAGQRVVNSVAFSTYDARNQIIGRVFGLDYTVGTNNEVLISRLDRPVLGDGNGGAIGSKGTSYFYDTNNRVIKTSTSGEPDTIYTYDVGGDADGYRITVRTGEANDAYHHLTYYHFTPEGWLRRKQVRDWSPATNETRIFTTEYWYNSAGQVVALNLASGAQYQYSYDSRGNKTRETVYLSQRRWQDSVDSDQVRTTRYEYDRDNQLTLERLEGRSGQGLADGQTSETNYGYENNDRRIVYPRFGDVGANAQVFSTVRESEEQRWIGGNLKRRFYQGVDEYGRVANTRLHKGSEEGAYRTVNFNFWDGSNSLNNRVQIPSGDGFGEWSDNRMVRSYADQVQNKQVDGQNVDTTYTNYHYDELGNVVLTQEGDVYVGKWTNSTPTTRSRETFDAYDGFGNKVWHRVLSQASGQDYNWYEQNQTWTYYATGELKAASVGLPGLGVRQLTNYTYDTNGSSTDFGRLFKSQTGSGDATTVSIVHGTLTYTYDGYGRIKSVTTDGFVTSMNYDTLDRVVKTTRPDSSYQWVRYRDDSNGVHRQVDGHINQAEVTTWHDLDALGREYQTVYPDGSNVRTFYDAFDRPVKFTDNRLTMNAEGDGRSTYLQYDTAGNLIAKLDPALVNGGGQAYADARRPYAQYGYDNFDRQTVQGVLLYGGTVDPNNLRFPANAAVAWSSKEYDALDRVTKATDGHGYATTMTYDRDNNLTTVDRQVWKGGEQDKKDLTSNFDWVTTRIAYNALGQPTQQVDGLGNSQTTTYNVQGQPVLQRDERGVLVKQYGYTADGLLQSIYGPDNASGEAMQRLEYREYDSRALPAQIYTAHMNTQAGPSSGALTAYEYDAQGRVTQMQIPRDDTGGQPVVTKTYNDFGKILSQTDAKGFVTDFIYDYRGLLTQKDESARTGNSTDSAAGLSNGLHSTYRYDLAGNLTYKNEQGLITEYRYNTLGKVIHESRPRASENTGTNWKLSTYRLDGLPSAQTNYTYAGDLTSRPDVYQFGDNPPSVTAGNLTIFEYNGRGDLWAKQSRGVGRNTDGSSSAVRTEYSQWQYVNGLGQRYKRVFGGDMGIYAEQRDLSGTKLGTADVLTYWKYDQNGNLTSKWDTPMGSNWQPRDSTRQNVFTYTYTPTNKEATSTRDIVVRVQGANDPRYTELTNQGGNTGILLTGSSADSTASYNERDALDTVTTSEQSPTPNTGAGSNTHYSLGTSVTRTTTYGYYVSGQLYTANVGNSGIRRIDSYDQRGRELKVYDSNGPLKSGNGLIQGVPTTITNSYGLDSVKTSIQHTNLMVDKISYYTLGNRLQAQEDIFYNHEGLPDKTFGKSRYTYDSSGNLLVTEISNNKGEYGENTTRNEINEYGAISKATKTVRAMQADKKYINQNTITNNYYDGNGANYSFQTTVDSDGAFTTVSDHAEYALDSRGNRVTGKLTNGTMYKRYNSDELTVSYNMATKAGFCSGLIISCQKNGISNRYNDFRYDPYNQEALTGTSDVIEGGYNNREYKIYRNVRSIVNINQTLQYIFGRGENDSGVYFRWANESGSGVTDNYTASGYLIKDQTYSSADGVVDDISWNGLRTFSSVSSAVVPLDAPIKPLSSILKINPLDLNEPSLAKLPDPGIIQIGASVGQQDTPVINAPSKDNVNPIETGFSKTASEIVITAAGDKTTGFNFSDSLSSILKYLTSQKNTEMGELQEADKVDKYLRNVINSTNMGSEGAQKDAIRLLNYAKNNLTPRERLMFYEGVKIRLVDYSSSTIGTREFHARPGDASYFSNMIRQLDTSKGKPKVIDSLEQQLVLDSISIYTEQNYQLELGSAIVTIAGAPFDISAVLALKGAGAVLGKATAARLKGLFTKGVGSRTGRDLIEEVLSCAARGANSFAARTPVRTLFGLAAISTLAVGTPVLAYNEQTGENGYYPITAVHRNVDPAITYLTLKDPEQADKAELITTTPEHPFYLAAPVDTQPRPKPQGHDDLSTRWVGAGHLKIGDRIKQADGTTGTVTNVITVQQTQEMFNLTVDEAHTFYVGQNGWLVHNCDDLTPVTNALERAIQTGKWDGTRFTAPNGDLFDIGLSASLKDGTLSVSDIALYAADGVKRGNLGIGGTRALYREMFGWAEKNGVKRVVLEYDRVASGSASNPGARTEIYQLVDKKWVKGK
jgi:YD repeat-containing protein